MYPPFPASWISYAAIQSIPASRLSAARHAALWAANEEHEDILLLFRSAFPFRLPSSAFIPSSALQWLPHHEGHEDILLLFRPAFPFRLPASTFRVQSGNGQHITSPWDACPCEPVPIWVACLVKGVNEFALRTVNSAATVLQGIYCCHHHRPCLYRTWDRNGQCRVLLDRCFACRCKHCSSSVFLLS